MPPKKNTTAASKASTATPRPRGRPAKKVVKSSELIDDETHEAADTTDDDDIKNVKSPVSSTADRPRPRPRPRPVTKQSKIVDDDDAIDISSEDDQTSIRSVKSAKSAMSVDDGEQSPQTPPRRSNLSGSPKTPISSRASSVNNKKRSASRMTSPFSDDDFRMLESPTKRMTLAQKVRFDNDVTSVAPLKGVLKKSKEVVHTKTKSSKDVEAKDEESEEDVFITSSDKSRDIPSKKVSIPNMLYDSAGEDKTNKRISKATTSKTSSNVSIEYDSDDGKPIPWSDEDSQSNVTPNKISVNTKGKKATKTDSEDVFLEDYVTSEPAPEEDESNIGNRDPAIIKTYDHLPNIRAACMISWSNKAPIHPCYTGMLLELPRMNKRLFYEAICFSGVANFCNISRADPAHISTGFGNQTYFHPVGGGAPFVFTSVIHVSSYHLEEPKVNSNGKMQKVIEGACIEGEWERLIGAIGQVIHAREFKGQLNGSNLSFGTAYTSVDSVMTSPSSNRTIRRTSGPSFSRGPGGGTNGVVLACNDTVPVYDARTVKNNFYKILSDLDEMNQFKGDVPIGSCVVVAYTINTWGKGSGGVPNISFNIKWAMILGTPGRKA